jgi:hypothetical protein
MHFKFQVSVLPQNPLRLFPNVREAFLMLILVLQGIYLKNNIDLFFWHRRCIYF